MNRFASVFVASGAYGFYSFGPFAPGVRIHKLHMQYDAGGGIECAAIAVAVSPTIPQFTPDDFFACDQLFRGPIPAPTATYPNMILVPSNQHIVLPLALTLTRSLYVTVMIHDYAAFADVSGCVSLECSPDLLI